MKQKKIIWASSLLLVLFFCFSCNKTEKQKSRNEFLGLDSISIDSLFSNEKLFDLVAQVPINFHSTPYNYELNNLLNTHIYESYNYEFLLNPCCRRPLEYPKGPIFCPCLVDIENEIMISYEHGSQNNFTIHYLGEEKRKRSFAVSIAGTSVYDIQLFYPKILIVSVSRLEVYDLISGKTIEVCSPHKIFNSQQNSQYFDTTKHFGWTSDYYSRNDSSCFIANFRELSDKSKWNYFIKLNPRNNEIEIYDSTLQRYVSNSKDTLGSFFKILFYTPKAGVIYSLNDKYYRIIDQNKLIKEELNIASEKLKTQSEDYLLIAKDSLNANIEIVSLETKKVIKKLNFKLPKNSNISGFQYY